MAKFGSKENRSDSGAAIGKIIGGAWPYFALHWTMNFITRGVSRISRLILTRYFKKGRIMGSEWSFEKKRNIDPNHRANFALSAWAWG